MGDLLFSCVNLARKLKVDPEQAVRGANQRFELRFRAIEGILRDRGTSPSQTELAEMSRVTEARTQLIIMGIALVVVVTGLLVLRLFSLMHIEPPPIK